MEAFSALLAICAGSFDIFFDLRVNKPLIKQSWDWWFETPSCPLWRHCNELQKYINRLQNLVIRAYVYKNN